MKVNYKILMYSFSAFLVGIFIGFVIIDQNLVEKWIQAGLLSWDAVSGFGSIFAACVALFVALRSWKKAQEVRRKDRLQKEIDSANIAFCHFRRLSRIASLLSSKSHIVFTSNGQVKQKIEEIYEGWKYANTSDDCVRSIIFADIKADELVYKSSLIDTLERALQVGKSGTHLSSEVVEGKGISSETLDSLIDALNTFKELSHLHILELMESKDSNLMESVISHAQDALENLKRISDKVQSTKS